MFPHLLLGIGGFAKLKNPEIGDNFGSGLVGPGLAHEKKIGKSFQNSPIIILIVW